MAQKIWRGPDVRCIEQPLIAKNSGAFAEADPVGINSDGFLETVSAGQSIFGWCNETKTVDADNTTVDKYKPQVIPAEGTEVYFGSSADCAQADLYAFKDFSTVTSGGFVVGMADLAAGGQVKIIAFDPLGESDNDVVIVVASEIEKLAFAKA